MPANAVKTKADEKKWSRAKKKAEEQGHKDDYAYIMSIYQNMKGGKNSKSEKESCLKSLADRASGILVGK
jgi:hypothetical protein